MTEEHIRDYRDLRVWRMAIDLDERCAMIADQLPRREWRLASQIRRAANSVHANIAEGNGSFTTADYLRHVGTSNKSLRELESHLYSVQRRYRRISGIAEALGECEQIVLLLGGLKRSLRRKLSEE